MSNAGVDEMASKSAVEVPWQADRHLLQPWPVCASIGAESRTRLTEGDGIYIHDGAGKRLIDGPAGMWCVNLGHRNEALSRAM